MTTIAITCLSIAILIMAVGFANWATNLNIQGSTTVGSSSWKIQYVTTSYVESANSVTVPAGNRTIDATSMEFSVALAQPGDFYEFTITVENAGTFDATLSSISMSSLTTEQAKYLTYTITINGQIYSQTNNSITGTNLLAAGAASNADKQDVTVRVEYVQPANSADLPSSQQSITLTATLNYVQKT